MNKSVERRIQQQLCTMQDKTYQAFQSKLMPTIAPDKTIGIRTPALRAFAKQIAGTPEAEQFLRHLPHVYYEENNLHAFLVSETKEFDDAVTSVDEFLPCIDNWATCDSFKPRAFKKNIPA